jgi:pyruvate,water dikinase
VASLRDFPVIGPDDRTVLVIPTVTPAHALAARGAVAVVCEYGDHLGHGAAMARELGIPCIVGCKRAWRELETGDEVGVHGDAGLVARLVRS